MKRTILTAVLCLFPAGLFAQQAKLVETELKEPAAKAAVKAPPEPPKPSSAVKTAPAKKPAARTAPVKEAAVLEPVKELTGPGAGFSVGKKHVVDGGDTLWDLSTRYYKDPYKWGKIYNANLSTVENPDRIYPREELVIPDITEEVRPEHKAAEVTGVDTAKEAELSSSDVAQPEEAAVEAEKPAPAPAQARSARAKVPPPAVGETLKGFALSDLSEEMPEHQKEWSGGVSVVPSAWREDGVITAKEKGKGDAMEESLTMGGELVSISMTKAGLAAAGDYLAVYMKGADALDKAGKKIGLEIQYAGMAEVVSAEGSEVKAVIIDAVTSISKGYIVKKK